MPERILALDLGKKRIGLAVSDALGMTAQGLPTLQRTRVREDIEKLSALCQEYEVSLLLFGDPVHMSGEVSPQSTYTHEFGERLAKRTGLPIKFVDERLTSWEAEQMLKERGTNFDRKSGAVDRLAAVMLLQDYMDRESHT